MATACNCDNEHRSPYGRNYEVINSTYDEEAVLDNTTADATATVDTTTATVEAEPTSRLPRWLRAPQPKVTSSERGR